MNVKLAHLFAGYWAGLYSDVESVKFEDATFSVLSPYMFILYRNLRGDASVVAMGSKVRAFVGGRAETCFFSCWEIGDQKTVNRILHDSWSAREPVHFLARSRLAGRIDGVIFPIREGRETANCYIGLLFGTDHEDKDGAALPLELIRYGAYSDVLMAQSLDINQRL